MTDAKPATNPNEAKPGTGGVYSLEDLDKILNEEDPGFNESLETIKQEAIGDTSSIESLQVDAQVNEDSDDEAEKKRDWRRRLLGYLLAPLTWARDKLRLRWLAFLNRLRLFKDQTVQFLKHELPERIKYYRSQLLALLTAAKTRWQQFSALSWGKKIALMLSVFFVGTALYFLGQALRGHWLPEWQSPLITSFAQRGKVLGQATQRDDFMPFFEAFPEVEIAFQMPKVIVNLKPSAVSPKAMGAFEFFLSLDTKETAIEVKDREKEFLDLSQRVTEEFTYEEIMSKEGQVRLKSRLRDELNERLNQGRVIRVYVSTMVTYRN